MTTGSDTLHSPAGRVRATSIVLLAAGACALGAPPVFGASPNALPRAAEDAQHAAPPPASAPVSRARILECGHQWNNMKRAGTAAGTWKDFSRVCLAQR